MNEMAALIEKVARALYEHEVATYDPDPDNVEAFWLDPDIRTTWLERASIVLTTLATSGVQIPTTQEVTA